MPETDISQSLPTFVVGVIVVGGVILVALLTYFASRALFKTRADEESRDLASSVIFRVAALHGLILALVFAQELVNVNQIRDATSREAALMADVFYDLKRYDDAGTLAIRTDVAHYVAAVVNEEWDDLAYRRNLSDEAWRRWVSTYEAILDLEPATAREELLQENLTTAIREVSGLRRLRENAVSEPVNPLFMTAAIVGVVITAMSYFTFAPTTLHLLLLSTFAAYTGLLIFFIIAFSNPYLEPGRISPVGFERLFTGEVQALWAASQG